MLAPLFVAGNNIMKRHEILKPSIGTFDIEDLSYDRVKFLLFTLPLSMIGLMLLDFIFLAVFNFWAHPLLILVSEDKADVFHNSSGIPLHVQRQKSREDDAEDEVDSFAEEKRTDCGDCETSTSLEDGGMEEEQKF